MNEGRGTVLSRWRPVLGMAAVGVFAFSLTLYAGPSKGRSGRSAGPGSLRKAPAPRGTAAAAQGIPVDIPVFPPVAARRTTEVEGRRFEGMLLGRDGGRFGPGVSDVPVPPGGQCLRDLDCDDCNPCTYDWCAMAVCDAASPPALQGRPCYVDAQCLGGTCVYYGGGIRKCVSFPVEENGKGECDDGLTCDPAGSGQTRPQSSASAG